jgi:hypothetical protein
MPPRPGHAGVMGPSEALAEARSAFVLGLADRPTDQPSMLVVEVDEGDDVARVNALAPTLPCVTIGVAAGPVGDPPLGFDVLLSTGAGPPRPWISCTDLDRTLADLGTRIAGSPLAAVALVQLLRMGERLSLRDAVVAESFVYSMLQAGPTFKSWLANRQPGLSDTSVSSPVLVTRDGAHMEIVLNRPSVHNALNRAMRDGLIDALEVVTTDSSVETVRISGAGPSFCSGGDLNEFGLAEDPATAHAVRVGRSVGLAVDACADRVAVDLHGSCVGAGIEIPAFAGRIRSSANAAFSLPEIAFGLIPGAGGTASIPRRIGRHRAAFMALSGGNVDAATALEWGLVDEIR